MVSHEERRDGKERRGQCDDGCRLLEEHGQLKADVVTLKRDKFMAVLFALATAGLGTFFGMWIQGQSDINRVVALQYEMKGQLTQLTDLVSRETYIPHQGATGPEGPRGPAGPAGDAKP